MTAAGTRGDGFVHLHVHTEYSMLDGAARLKDMFAACREAGMPAVAITDHGNVYGAYDFWAKATRRRHQADHRDRGLRGPRAPAVPAAGALGNPGAEGRRRVRRRGVHPHDAARRDHRGHAQPVPAVLACLARRLFPQAPDGPRTAGGARQGHHRHHRLRVGRGADQAPARPVRRGGRGGGRLPRHLRARTTSSSRSWTTAWTSRRGRGTAWAASPGTCRCRSWSPTTRTTPGRTTPPRTRCCSRCRPLPRWPTRTGSGSRARATTSRAHRRCARSAPTKSGRQAATPPWR